MNSDRNGVTQILEEIHKFLENNQDLMVEGGKEELLTQVLWAAVLLNRSDLLKIHEYHEKYPPLTWIYAKNKKLWNLGLGLFFIVANLWLVNPFRRMVLLGLNGVLGFPSIEFVDFMAPGSP